MFGGVLRKNASYLSAGLAVLLQDCIEAGSRNKGFEEEDQRTGEILVQHGLKSWARGSVRERRAPRRASLGYIKGPTWKAEGFGVKRAARGSIVGL